MHSLCKVYLMLGRRDFALVREMGLKLKYVANTHVHADHITGCHVTKATQLQFFLISEYYDSRNRSAEAAGGGRQLLVGNLGGFRCCGGCEVGRV